MIKKVLLIGIILCTTAPYTHADEVRALYGFSKELFDGKNPVQIVQVLRQWGINAVFVSKKDFGLIKVLHGSGIKVYYELACFSGEEYWERFPDSRPVDANGEPIPKVAWYAGVCPNHSKVRQEKLDELKTVLSAYDFDGVWLDFIRYPCHWEEKDPAFWQTCFCKRCHTLFQKHVGIPLSPRDILIHYRRQWVDWRCKRISDFVRDVRSIVDKEQPGTVLGLFGVPWTHDDYDNAIEGIIGQKYEDLANYVDIFSPMLYHRMCGRDVSWIHEYVTYLERTTTRAIVPIIQASDERVNITADEFRNTVHHALRAPSNGIIILELRTLLEEKRQSILQQELK